MATLPTEVLPVNTMATTSTAKPEIEISAGVTEGRLPSWPADETTPPFVGNNPAYSDPQTFRPSGRDALQALLAFAALHQQVRHRRALNNRHAAFDSSIAPPEFEPGEQFVLDEVLHLVAERGVAITGADGLGIALAENNEIVLRASAGTIKPDVGARIQRDSSFSGACFRMAEIIRCDDSETDDRVNLYACRQLGARSMVAVPLCGRRRVIGLLEAFSSEPFGFNDSDVCSLELLAELIVGALKPEDEDRFAKSAQAAEAKLDTPVAPDSIEIATEPAAPPSIAEKADEAKPASSADNTAASAANGAELSAPVEETQAASSISSAENTLFKTYAQPASSSHHPGIVFVLVLFVVVALSAVGLWWKLKNAQLGEMLIKPEPKINRAAGSANSALPTPGPSSNSTQSAEPEQATAELNSSTDDQDSAAEGAENTPQEPSKLSRVSAIRHWSSADTSTVVLDLEDQVQYEAHRLAKPDRIYFDLHDTSLAPGFESKTIDINDALLAKVRVAQPSPGLTRVVLETKGNSSFSVSLEPNPYRLVVQVHKPGASPKTAVNLFPGTSETERMAIVVPPPTKEDLQLRARVPKMRIVIDAGHGGWDLGTVGRRGLLEKDLVLEVAQRLGKLLESRLGTEVVLTRNDDSYIPLDERASLANQSHADLFVSIHANYSDLPSARGVETYFTNRFTSPNAKDLETRSGIGSKDFATASLSSVDLHEKIQQSRRLAASVQRSLYSSLSVKNPGLRDRGIKEASYVVLVETAMPGILAEVSFVSSPTDEQKLQNDGYREQIAEALYRGLARYAASAHSVKIAAAAK
jgi:N-acetylmuramoyl-L-alanine amidase/putative methionine-R-sulfoxide reductase with GAF domain